MKLYAGIDLHSNNSVVAIIDEQDRVVLQKRFPNELERILLALASFKQWLVGVVVESTYNWYWLVDGLMQAGLQGASGQPGGDRAVPGTQVQRR